MVVNQPTYAEDWVCCWWSPVQLQLHISGAAAEDKVAIAKVLVQASSCLHVCLVASRFFAGWLAGWRRQSFMFLFKLCVMVVGAWLTCILQAWIMVY